MVQPISAPDLAAWLADESREQPLLLDVREGWEFQHCAIAGSQLVSMNSVPARVDEIDAERPVVCICHHGMRSMQVANFLQQRGFERVFNLSGGVNAWALQVDPAMPRY